MPLLLPAVVVAVAADHLWVIFKSTHSLKFVARLTTNLFKLHSD